MNGIKTGFFETAGARFRGIGRSLSPTGFPVDWEKEENS
jgi:hypothetical protein